MQNFVGAPDGKTKLGSSRYRKCVIVETDRREMREKCRVDSNGFGQGAVTGCCEHNTEPSDTIKC
jgi:hypothetical protein